MPTTIISLSSLRMVKVLQWNRVKNELTICKDKKKTISFTFQVLWRGGRYLRCGDKVTGWQSMQIKKLIIYNRLSTVPYWCKSVVIHHSWLVKINLYQFVSGQLSEENGVKIRARKESKTLSKISLIRIKEKRSKILLFIYHTASFLFKKILAFNGTPIRTGFCRRNKLETTASTNNNVSQH